MSQDPVRFQCDLSAPTTPLPHVWEHTVGSGHALLALRADWQRQLARAHAELGFRHVRFHGLLSDDVGPLVKQQGRLVQSFFNTDQIWDYVLSIGMRPFVELSFMPTAIASGSDFVFHYRGNVTPPKDYGQWEGLVRDLAVHWVQRYGLEEVSQWFFEVWNEANLSAFWKGTRDDYFQLYRSTATALKGVSPSLRVGGPASAKNAWIPELLGFCQSSGTPLDFVTTHQYPTDALGQAGDDTEAALAQVERSVLRAQTETAFHQAEGRPLYYTEWSGSSNPFDHLHDEPYAAAFVAKTVLEARDMVKGYSYWTFSDIFEENYFDSRPFHGGFGLLTVHGIAKPAYRAFELLHRLGDEAAPVEGRHPTVDAWVSRCESTLTIMLTNWALPRHAIEEQTVRISLRHTPPIRSATVERIDAAHANAKATWEAMDRLESLLPAQVEILDQASELQRETLVPQVAGDTAELEVVVPPQGTALITLEVESTRLPDPDHEMFTTLERETFDYFVRQASPQTGLTADSSEEGSPASIAVVGLALSANAVAVERGLLPRRDAIRRTLTTLRFLRRSPQGADGQATGYHGLYYHFLDMRSGARAGGSEVSTIDTALLMAGVLSAGLYFDGPSVEEEEIRALADELYRRVDWAWALTAQGTLGHGWTPEDGFLSSSWSKGYCEALLLFMLALGSPTSPIPPEVYRHWTETFERVTAYGHEYVYAGPLFVHQFSHAWIDFRGIRDERNRRDGFDYFENTARATQVHRQYAIENPHGFKHYSRYGWGLSACAGPGPASKVIDGIPREFLGYVARGAPFGPDDGTLSPWAVVASLPFAPRAVSETVRHAIKVLAGRSKAGLGFDGSFNPTFPSEDGDRFGWASRSKYGLNEGFIVLMIENHFSGLLWSLFRKCPYVITGLRRAGFSGGWLDSA